MVFSETVFCGSTKEGSTHMIKKTFIAAAVTAAALGTGGAALATTQDSHAALSLAAPSTSSSTSPLAATTPVTPTTKAHTPTAKNKGKHKGKQGARNAKRHARLGNALHGTWVTKKGKTGAVVTHDAIRGTASAVSATSITVTAADKVSQTYVVTSKTRVRVFDAATHKPVKSSISAVKSGQKVMVAGTGTTTLTATGVVVGKHK